MLDLVFLRFEVLNARGNVKSAVEEGKGESVGAYTIALGALMPGAQHVHSLSCKVLLLIPLPLGRLSAHSTVRQHGRPTPFCDPVSPFSRRPLGQVRLRSCFSLFLICAVAVVIMHIFLAWTPYDLSAERTLSAGLPTSPPRGACFSRLHCLDCKEWVKGWGSCTAHKYSTDPRLAVGKEEQLPTIAAPAADLTPSSSAAAESKKTSYHRRLAALALLLPLAFFLSFPRDLLSTGVGCHHSRFSHSEIAKCPTQPAPRSVGADWNPVGDDEYKKLAVQRFSGAIKVVSPSFRSYSGNTCLSTRSTTESCASPHLFLKADGELRRLWYTR